MPTFSAKPCSGNVQCKEVAQDPVDQMWYRDCTVNCYNDPEVNKWRNIFEACAFTSVRSIKEKRIFGKLKSVNGRLKPNPYASKKMEEGQPQCVSKNKVLQPGVYCARDLDCQANDKKATCYYPEAALKPIAFCAIPDACAVKDHDGNGRDEIVMRNRYNYGAEIFEQNSLLLNSNTANTLFYSFEGSDLVGVPGGINVKVRWEQKWSDDTHKPPRLPLTGATGTPLNDEHTAPRAYLWAGGFYGGLILFACGVAAIEVLRGSCN